VKKRCEEVMYLSNLVPGLFVSVESSRLDLQERVEAGYLVGEG